MLHEGGDLRGYSDQRGPSLSVLSIAADKGLLSSSRASNRRLSVLMSTVCTCLHPLGSVVACVPHPWHQHLGLIAGERVRRGLAGFCFCFFKSSGGWVKIKLKLPHFHVSDTCRVSI